MGGRGDPAADRDAQPDERERRSGGNKPASARPALADRRDIDWASGHDLTVPPRFWKKVTIAGAAPTRNAAAAEMIVPRRPTVVWW